MGIEVSAAKAVRINDQHQNGVDTSVDGNPSQGHFRGIPLIFVFNRNQRGARRDDGNPLVHALKGRKGFSILPFWKDQIMTKAQAILAKAGDALQGIDFVVPMPSSSPFCAEFAALVSAVTGAPMLASDFLRKRQVGEILAETKANPPKVSAKQDKALAEQIRIWEGMSADALYQAKEVVEMRLRAHFNGFALEGPPPDIAGKHVLIVDDIFATGSSLSSVRAIVGNQLGAKVSAIFFLSGV